MKKRLPGQDSISQMLACGSGHVTNFYQWNGNKNNVCHSEPMLLRSWCFPLRFSFSLHCMDGDNAVPGGGAKKGKPGSLDHHLGAG